MTDWLLIETAPKDGEDIILYIPGITHPVQIGYWYDRKSVVNGRIEYEKAEWYYGTFFVPLNERPAPTHWMPIPANPPNAGADLQPRRKE